MRRFYINRRTLGIFLCALMMSVFSLSIAYAALSVTLNISGNSEVIGADWDIHLANVNVTEGSVNSNLPTITNGTTANFSAVLTKPGDYYEFTIDVINDGTIDAMIQSVSKTPTLSAEQAKYFNYTIEYENGESILANQLVKAKNYVRLEIRLEYRKDLIAESLPTTNSTLNLSFTVNYIQSNDAEELVTIPNSGVKVATVLSGDGTNVGDEVEVKGQKFYVINNNGLELTLLSKYNLEVGSTIADDSYVSTPISDASGIQDENSKGYVDEIFPWKAIVPFSSSAYWTSSVILYPVDVYSNSASISAYVNAYKTYLTELGLAVREARLITTTELANLGCSTNTRKCSIDRPWVYSTSYWTGTAGSTSDIWGVSSYGIFNTYNATTEDTFGVRPVIVVSSSAI